MLAHASSRRYLLYADTVEGPGSGTGRSGGPEGGRAHGGGWHRTIHPAPGGGLAAPRVNAGISEKVGAGGGHKQYENIILANYSAASLVLSKIL